MMAINQKNKSALLLALFCLAVIAANGQKYRAAVQKVDSPGFYKITLKPAFVAKSEASLSDLRLQDAKGRDISYVNSSDVPVNKGGQFVVFPKMEPELQKDTGTNIVVENMARGAIDRIWIKVKNTDVIRSLNITGSDDLKNWFAITEHVPLEKPGLSNEDGYELSITFAPSIYHYLKILVNDKNKAPVNFLQAGIYITPSLENNYQPILPVIVTQHDTVKISYVTIDLDDKYLINKIHLAVKGPKYFKRTVAIYDAGLKALGLISETELNSATGSNLFLSVKTKRVLLIIANDDNLPLAITNAQVYQADEYIVGYLETGQYYLLTGNANAVAPNYDLKFFKDSLHGFIPRITHLEVVKNPAYHFSAAAKKKENAIIVWLAIIVSLLLLSLLSSKMMTEVNKKQPNE